MDLSKLDSEIVEWDAGNKDQYDSYQSAYANFIQRAESHGDVVLPSGRVEFVDHELNHNDDDSLGVFTVNGELFAVSGYYSSWGSEWDNGLKRVEKRTLTIERYEVI